MALPNTTKNSTTTTKLRPSTGITNTIVPLPPKFADGHFQLPRPYNDAHQLIITTNADLSLSEASIATSCLEECVAYSSDGKKCKSIFVNHGKSATAQKVFPPGSDPDEVKWWCHGYDVLLPEEVFIDVGVCGEETYEKGVVVNRGGENVGFGAF